MYDLTGDGGVSDVTIGFVGGGSRDWAEKMMHALALTTDFGGRVRLYDLDYESALENEALGRRIQDHPDAVGEWEYEAVETLAAALEGADFVICSTQDPPAETFKHDLDLPKQYGISQTVGDTVGPGGTFRAFRAFRNDPLVTIDPLAAKSLFADLVAAEREYLADYDLEDARILA